MIWKRYGPVFLGIMLFAGFVQAQQAAPKKLIILHTNDLHSRLNGFSPEVDYSPLSLNDDQTRGGFARIATLIARERAKYPDHVLVLDAGDFLMGTFFSILEETSGFQLVLMRKMGYDVVTLGNHEFDFGPRALASLIESSGKNGPLPMLVASNLLFSAKDTADDALQALWEKNVLTSYRIIEKNGLKIGIFGILGYSAIHDAPLARPVGFEDPVKAAAKTARLLKEKEKTDLVICLSHSGVTRQADGLWSGEDVMLAQKVPEIDVIISGHTHTLIEKPLVVSGKPLVQTGSYGTGLGRLEIEVSGGKITRSDSRILPVTDSVPGDPEIQRMITKQEQLITNRFLASKNLNYSSILAETSFPLICDQDTLLEKSNLGPLICDALYAYVKQINPPGSDITIFPAGMIRDNILPGAHGKQSVADIFRVVSLGSGKDDVPGYPLARVYVTAKELKGIMEILYLAPAGNSDNYIFFGGLNATYNSEKGLLKKITLIETGDAEKGFAQVDWSKQNTALYSLTANVYMLEFVSIIKKLSKGLVNVTLKNDKGEPLKSVWDAVIDADPLSSGVQEVKEWMALVWYLRQQSDLNGNGIPDIPERYRTGNPRLHKE